MSIGPWTFPPYTIRILWGALAGLLWLVGAAPHYGIRRRELLELAWGVLAGTILGGRLGYGIEQAAYFLAHPLAIGTPDPVGGLHGGAAWIGGLLSIALWARYRGRPIFPLWSLWTPPALMIAAGVWWGCWDAGCAWGQEVTRTTTVPSWLVIRSADLYHLVTPRYAVQPAGILGAGLLILPAMLLGRRGALVLPFYWLIEAGLSFFRGDPALWFGPGRLDLWLDAALAVGVGWTYLGSRFSGSRNGNRE